METRSKYFTILGIIASVITILMFTTGRTSLSDFLPGSGGYFSNDSLMNEYKPCPSANVTVEAKVNWADPSTNNIFVERGTGQITVMRGIRRAKEIALSRDLSKIAVLSTGDNLDFLGIKPTLHVVNIDGSHYQQIPIVANATNSSPRNLSWSVANTIQIYVEGNGRQLKIGNRNIEKPGTVGITLNWDNSLQKISQDQSVYGFLGVAMTCVLDNNRTVKNSENSAALVSNLVNNGPAYKGGLRRGDLILRIGENDVFNPADIGKILINYSPNDLVNVVIRRDNKLLERSIILGKKSEII